MNKSELIDEIARESGLSKGDSEKALNATVQAITNAMKSGNNVQLVGFGTFQVRQRNARTGRNPKTGESIQIEASKVPAFSPGKALKEALKG